MKATKAKRQACEGCASASCLFSWILEWSKKLISHSKGDRKAKNPDGVERVNIVVRKSETVMKRWTAVIACS